MLMHAKVFAAAVKYMVPSLKQAPIAKFKSAILNNWNHHSFGLVLKTMYTTTPDLEMDLRTIVVDTMMNREGMLDKECVENVIHEIPTLAYQLLKAWKLKVERDNQVDRNMPAE
ncbi:hypothetical protein K470DRAFT_259890 [Piedraia hortae CBS 480.64]|uniref:Uncharacterized protein n=1 Tax=Piedraia hortae CBS 480.64 TaxID=1314780 RepID=A0A6A7BV69_9PEZI|nr:hypothetical protein K470DRAFT_259890 [Piedraia hortae CBS 480.64]